MAGMLEHILVVEDAPEFQHIHRESLTKAGYKVSVAGDGARALEIARSTEPEVIILDLVLPDVDGMDLCAQFRKFTDSEIRIDWKGSQVLITDVGDGQTSMFECSPGGSARTALKDVAHDSRPYVHLESVDNLSND